MKNQKYIFLFLFSMHYCGAQDLLQLDSTVLLKREITVGLNKPWEIKWGPDDHLWVTERIGLVKRIDPITGNTSTILNLDKCIPDIYEAGMLGFCFHPDFENNKLVYLSYDISESSINHNKTIALYEYNSNELILNKIIWKDIPTWTNHSGCRLAISEDHKLFVTLGDRFVKESSQDMTTPSGKIHRLNLDGSIPDDNPFPNSTIYSYGHRNPQGLLIRPDGIIFSTEHGASKYDELNLIESGKNYGWPIVEGICDTSNEGLFCQENEVVEPIWQTEACTAINDISYYNHEAIPEWQNKILMAVLGGYAKKPSLSVYKLSENNQVENIDHHLTELGRLRDVCINPHTGSIYIATNGYFPVDTMFNSIIEYYNPEYKPTFTATEISINQFFNINPNPVNYSNAIFIKCSENFINTQLDFFTLNGEIIFSYNIVNSNFSLATNTLSKGVFIVRASNEKGIITRKIIIQ